MKQLKPNKPLVPYSLLLAGLFIAVFLQSCSSAQQQAPQSTVPALPVLQVGEMPATTFREYTASLEGKTNVEIRAQVDGYLEEIYADEGAYVKAGQPLFRINASNYREQANNAQAALAAAQANLDKAQLEVDRLTPLVKNNIVSDVQLKNALAVYHAAQASVAQARAMKGNAEINVGYTLIKAPVSGYIGRIPYKKGSLVGRGEVQPLTVISDISEVYAYFSMSEVDFLDFKNNAAGATMEQKLQQLPPVDLILADNSVYPVKGKVETVEGQFDKTAGSISFRATFPNTDGSLRSGNTGRVRIPRHIDAALIVPQEATFEIQDKVFVYAVADSNKVVSKPIAIAGKTSNYYFVSGGVKPGEKIVLSGTGNLKDGAVIAPQMVSGDSLLKAKPL